jgi:hypothetical protein
MQFITEAASAISGLWTHMEMHQALSIITSSTDVAPLVNKRLNESAKSLHSFSSPNHNHHGSSVRLTSNIMTSSQRNASVSSLASRHSFLHGSSSLYHNHGIGIYVAVLEPVIPLVKGHVVSENVALSNVSSVLDVQNSEPFGSVLQRFPYAGPGVSGLKDHSHVSEMKREWGIVTSRVPEEKAKWVIGGGHLHGSLQRSTNTTSAEYKPKPASIAPVAGTAAATPKTVWDNASPAGNITPKGAIELFTDFCQMFDVLTQQQGLTRVKRYGNLVCVVTTWLFATQRINIP